MTIPVRTLLDPLLISLDPQVTAAIRQVLDLFPDAYRAGQIDVLARISRSLTDDQQANVPLTEQRLIAALNGAQQAVPDVWAIAPPSL